MASYFYLELDTTPPVLEILSIDYTTRNSPLQVLISSSEVLSLYQDIYLINSAGERVELIFSISDDLTFLEGNVELNDQPFGNVIICVQLKDRIGNLTGLYSKNIRLLEENKYQISSETLTSRISDEKDEAVIESGVYDINSVTTGTSDRVDLRTTVVDYPVDIRSGIGSRKIVNIDMKIE